MKIIGCRKTTSWSSFFSALIAMWSSTRYSTLAYAASWPLVASTFWLGHSYRLSIRSSLSLSVEKFPSWTQILLLRGDGERLTDGHDKSPWMTKRTSRIARARRRSRSSTREVSDALNWRPEASMIPSCRQI